MKTMDCLNLNTRRSVEVECLISGRQAQQSNSQSLSKHEFSFNRQARLNHENILKQKYSEIYNDLKILNSTDITQLLLEELEENQRFKKQIFDKNNKIQILEQQLQDSKQALRKKRQAINLLCETQSKNLQLIQKLENKISKRNERNRDTHYEKKYQQLSIYMNQYIRNINLAQQEFMKAYSTLKNENVRLTKQLQISHDQYIQMYKKSQILSQKIKKYEHQIAELCQIRAKLSSNINIVTQENEILKKQIQIIQQNIRITDRLQVHIAKQHNQLSSELDFIKQKIFENQNISKDIIQKLQESSSNCQKIHKDKDKFFESLQRSKDKCSGLERQINMLKTRNQQLQQDVKLLRKQYDLIANERDDIQQDLMRQKLQKQSIRKQLLGLADKVRLMESTYKKQIQQSQKIKGQLFKFWENKQKKENIVVKESSCKVLTEIKQNGCQFSQTTIAVSEKQSKLSLWPKRNDNQTSFNIYEKQNNESRENIRDSLCE